MAGGGGRIRRWLSAGERTANARGCQDARRPGRRAGRTIAEVSDRLRRDARHGPAVGDRRYRRGRCVLTPEPGESPAPPLLVKFLILLILFYALFRLVADRFRAWRGRSRRERGLAVRMTAFTWLLVLLVVAAAVLLPGAHRLLLLAPVVVIGVAIGKTWQSARLRARREAAGGFDLERMKRLN